MSTATKKRVAPGVPAGGQFAATEHPEPAVALKVPSAVNLHQLVFEDRLSNEEKRSYTRQALEQSLEGDDFNIIYTREQVAAIRKESERDDAVNYAIDTLEIHGCRPHHFGAEVALILHRSHARRDAVEKHYVPAAGDTFHITARQIPNGTEAYRKALEIHMPNVDQRWIEQMLKFQQQQPEGWHRKQLYTLAIMNERQSTGMADRAIVSPEENPNFVNHPVSALESDIDQAILAGVDVTDDRAIDEFHAGNGRGYGTVNIKVIASRRLAARRTEGQS